MTHVVIAGRDAPLWLAALALRRALKPAGVSVTAVEMPTALGPADAYTTLPAIEALHARIGIDEAALLRATGGVFSLGTNFIGPDGAFLLGWGSHGAPVEGTPFFPVWLRAHCQGLDARLQDFSLTSVAALNGRLMLGDDATASFARTDYAYTLPARAYAGVLKGLAVQAGIATRQAVAVAAEQDSGTIAALRLDGSERIEGDLFVDASGEEAVLASALGGGLESWQDRFPADRRLVARGPALRSIPAYLEQRALPSGWLRLQPTRDATRLVAAFDRSTGEESMIAQVGAAAGMPIDDVAITGLAPGRRSDPWRGNCVALGGAACTLDPALGLDLHVVQLGIVHLLSLFPPGPDAVAERAEYNRLLASHLGRLADAQQAIYAAAPWPGTFWDRGRAAPPSPALAHRIATFRARGQVAPMEDDTFDETMWQALLVGLGVLPETWPPGVDRLSPEAIRTAFRGMFGFIRDKVLEQPTHDAYLADVVGRPAA